ncbi:hypothetical protein LTR78_003267 [Recurvomyces mirabilis]|uniref:Zn(2)-C6 fungal-type domain-containing protein n=1 Tax=Recurvomyces mirabilis TaxID=574656 RepID=A0AAE0WSG1_9PEZI|nr:hypothetical protein LTR78_003267 [Recurvomyces mirabilis]KAK5156915.1 hypothetical protein LTS14_004432 [Recurvomyces mirabilis]
MEEAAPQSRPVTIAPAFDGMPRQQDNSGPPQASTCTTCARRKVKCDKTGPPCATCKKGRLNCYYEAPAPRKRKRKPIEDVYERLEQYESLLKQHGLLDQSEKASPTDETPTNGVDAKTTVIGEKKTGPTAGELLGMKTGKLVNVRGKSRYIDSTLWTNLNEEELHPSSEEDESGDDDLTRATSFTNGTSESMAAGILSGGSPGASLLNFHPTYDAAMKMWKVFQSHVEPLTKLLHVPTATALVQRAAANPSSASKAVECLIFVIYHFACAVMDEEECEELMHQSQSVLQKKYHAAAVQGLVNASFVRTTDLMVVQAYVLFLLSVRTSYDPHTFWILTGIGVRLGQRIGLHRDPEDLGVQPFEVQMRRRLFWQLLPLDGIASVMSGTGMAAPYETWDTKQPLNIDDEDIWPDMAETPVERTGATDMMFCMMRTEFGRFHKKMKPFFDGAGKLWQAGNTAAADEMEQAIADLEETMESKYLRYADPVYPLHLLALLLGRGAPQNARLRLRLPRMRMNPDVTEEEKKTTWKMCLKMFDYDKSAHTNPVLRKFSWHMQAVFQWDSVIWVLNEVRRGSPAIMDPSEAWTRIEWMFECHPQFMRPGRALHFAIRKLALKAWDGQPDRFKPADRLDPSFIKQLRMMCEKRSAGSISSESTTQPKPNPWSPPVDNGDTFVPVDPAIAAPMDGIMLSTAIETNFLDGFSADNVDWVFWDQLIQDSGSLPPAINFGSQ